MLAAGASQDLEVSGLEILKCLLTQRATLPYTDSGTTHINEYLLVCRSLQET